MSRLLTPHAVEIWIKAVESLPDKILKFPLNNAVDILPHIANLYLLKKESSTCSLCGENQSLIHVLNACSVVRDKKRYNVRHDQS